MPHPSSVARFLGVSTLTLLQSATISVAGSTGSSSPISWLPFNNFERETGGRHRSFTASTYTPHNLDSSLMRGSYAWARDWDDLVRAFRDSFTDSAMDELILLLRSKSPRPYGWKSNFARPIIYDRFEDITSGRALQVPKQADGPSIFHPSPASTMVADNQIDESHDAEDGQEDTLHEDVVEEDHEQDPAAQEDHEVQTPESQAKVDAARRIQAACILHLTRKKAIATGVHAIRTRFWNQLETRAAGMIWSRSSTYKLILRGPVVHVLVCLDVLGAAADSVKRDVKKRSKVAHHEELEELMESQERYRSGPSRNSLPQLTALRSFI